MIIVPNKMIPLKGFVAMTVWPLLFVRKDSSVTDVVIRHESIHGRQQRELLLVPFYFWYFLEWIVRAVQYGSWHTGYRNISFEREAYFFETDEDYLHRRKPYAWLHWLRKHNGTTKMEKIESNQINERL